MHVRNERYRTLAVTLFLVGIATFVVHEGFHWLAGTISPDDFTVFNSKPEVAAKLRAMVSASMTVSSHVSGGWER